MQKKKKNILTFSVDDLLTWIIKTGARKAFENAVIVLQLLLTIAISVTSRDRSFSKSKRLKTYLRSTMSQTRLRGLTIISIDKNLARTIDYDEIFKTSAPKKSKVGSYVVIMYHHK